MNELTKLDRLLDDVFPELSFRNFRKGNDIFTPMHDVKINYPVDIYDTKDDKVFEIVVLDAKSEDINVKIKGKVLTAQYEKAKKEDEDEKEYECRHITRRAFSFSWRLSELYLLDKAFVELHNGVLKISVPKAEKLKEQKLMIVVPGETVLEE